MTSIVRTTNAKKDGMMRSLTLMLIFIPSLTRTLILSKKKEETKQTQGVNCARKPMMNKMK